MFIPDLSYCAMYQWTDKNGNLIVTDDLYKVPEKYRQKQPVSSDNEKIDKQGEKESAPFSPAPVSEKSKSTIGETPPNVSTNNCLDGAWVATSMEFNGETASAEMTKHTHFRFVKDMVFIRGSSTSSMVEKEMTCTFRTEVKKPNRLFIKCPEGVKVFVLIINLTEDLLELCYGPEFWPQECRSSDNNPQAMVKINFVREK